jgi:hypothetical protein
VDADAQAGAEPQDGAGVAGNVGLVKRDKGFFEVEGVSVVILSQCRARAGSWRTKPVAAIWLNSRISPKTDYLQREPDGGCNAHHLYQLSASGHGLLTRQVFRGSNISFRLLRPFCRAIGFIA